MLLVEISGPGVAIRRIKTYKIEPLIVEGIEGVAHEGLAQALTSDYNNQHATNPTQISPPGTGSTHHHFGSGRRTTFL